MVLEDGGERAASVSARDVNFAGVRGVIAHLAAAVEAQGPGAPASASDGMPAQKQEDHMRDRFDLTLPAVHQLQQTLEKVRRGISKDMLSSMFGKRTQSDRDMLQRTGAPAETPARVRLRVRKESSGLGYFEHMKSVPNSSGLESEYENVSLMLSRDFVQAALALADELDINELQAASVLFEARRIAARAPHKSVSQLARELVLAERANLILLLQDILRAPLILGGSGDIKYTNHTEEDTRGADWHINVPHHQHVRTGASPQLALHGENKHIAALVQVLLRQHALMIKDGKLLPAVVDLLKNWCARVSCVGSGQAQVPALGPLLDCSDPLHAIRVLGLSAHEVTLLAESAFLATYTLQLSAAHAMLVRSALFAACRASQTIEPFVSQLQSQDEVAHRPELARELQLSTMPQQQLDALHLVLSAIASTECILLLTWSCALDRTRFRNVLDVQSGRTGVNGLLEDESFLQRLREEEEQDENQDDYLPVRGVASLVQILFELASAHPDERVCAARAIRACGPESAGGNGQALAYLGDVAGWAANGHGSLCIDAALYADVLDDLCMDVCESCVAFALLDSTTSRAASLVASSSSFDLPGGLGLGLGPGFAPQQVSPDFSAALAPEQNFVSQLAQFVEAVLVLARTQSSDAGHKSLVFPQWMISPRGSLRYWTDASGGMGIVQQLGDAVAELADLARRDPRAPAGVGAAFAEALRAFLALLAACSALSGPYAMTTLRFLVESHHPLASLDQLNASLQYYIEQYSSALYTTQQRQAVLVQPPHVPVAISAFECDALVGLLDVVTRAAGTITALQSGNASASGSGFGASLLTATLGTNAPELPERVCAAALLDVPIELKTALVRALISLGDERQMSAFLESATGEGSGPRALNQQPCAGLVADISGVEAALGSYAFSRSVLDLATMLQKSHTFGNANGAAPSNDGTSHALRRITIFALDVVLAKWTVRAYSSDEERWALAESALAFVDAAKHSMTLLGALLLPVPGTGGASAALKTLACCAGLRSMIYDDTTEDNEISGSDVLLRAAANGCGALYRSCAQVASRACRILLFLLRTVSPAVLRHLRVSPHCVPVGNLLLGEGRSVRAIASLLRTLVLRDDDTEDYNAASGCAIGIGMHPASPMNMEYGDELSDEQDDQDVGAYAAAVLAALFASSDVYAAHVLGSGHGRIQYSQQPQEQQSPYRHQFRATLAAVAAQHVASATLTSVIQIVAACLSAAPHNNAERLGLYLLGAPSVALDEQFDNGIGFGAEQDLICEYGVLAGLLERICDPMPLLDDAGRAQAAGFVADLCMGGGRIGCSQRVSAAVLGFLHDLNLADMDSAGKRLYGVPSFGVNGEEYAAVSGTFSPRVCGMRTLLQRIANFSRSNGSVGAMQDPGAFGRLLGAVLRLVALDTRLCADSSISSLQLADQATDDRVDGVDGATGWFSIFSGSGILRVMLALLRACEPIAQWELDCNAKRLSAFTCLTAWRQLLGAELCASSLSSGANSGDEGNSMLCEIMTELMEGMAIRDVGPGSGPGARSGVPFAGRYEKLFAIDSGRVAGESVLLCIAKLYEDALCSSASSSVPASVPVAAPAGDQAGDDQLEGAEMQASAVAAFTSASAPVKLVSAGEMASLLSSLMRVIVGPLCQRADAEPTRAALYAAAVFMLKYLELVAGSEEHDEGTLGSHRNAPDSVAALVTRALSTRVVTSVRSEEGMSTSAIEALMATAAQDAAAAAFPATRAAALSCVAMFLKWDTEAPVLRMDLQPAAAPQSRALRALEAQGRLRQVVSSVFAEHDAPALIARACSVGDVGITQSGTQTQQHFVSAQDVRSTQVLFVAQNGLSVLQAVADMQGGARVLAEANVFELLAALAGQVAARTQLILPSVTRLQNEEQGTMMMDTAQLDSHYTLAAAAGASGVIDEKRAQLASSIASICASVLISGFASVAPAIVPLNSKGPFGTAVTAAPSASLPSRIVLGKVLCVVDAGCALLADTIANVGSRNLQFVQAAGDVCSILACLPGSDASDFAVHDSGMIGGGSGDEALGIRFVRSVHALRVAAARVLWKLVPGARERVPLAVALSGARVGDSSGGAFSGALSCGAARVIPHTPREARRSSILHPSGGSVFEHDIARTRLHALRSLLGGIKSPVAQVLSFFDPVLILEADRHLEQTDPQTPRQYLGRNPPLADVLQCALVAHVELRRYAEQAARLRALAEQQRAELGFVVGSGSGLGNGLSASRLAPQQLAELRTFCAEEYGLSLNSAAGSASSSAGVLSSCFDRSAHDAADLMRTCVTCLEHALLILREYCRAAVHEHGAEHIVSMSGSHAPRRRGEAGETKDRLEQLHGVFGHAGEKAAEFLIDARSVLLPFFSHLDELADSAYSVGVDLAFTRQMTRQIRTLISTP
ncbi:hypothetical protein FVE85_7550 [Porphyridium purpureum]|uniref:Uncharacterized protein n=1 Tax=Porphyridium purpureum TaxID=35688 RepID=A0A5J4Z9F5_PORPP|nr:hypothetical protein FVE85_7550 [Porphyridium purpureum]|eukprot:POR4203..scf295_1